MGDFAVVSGADLNFLLTVLKNWTAEERVKEEESREEAEETGREKELTRGVRDIDMCVKLYISRIL